MPQGDSKKVKSSKATKNKPAARTSAKPAAASRFSLKQLRNSQDLVLGALFAELVGAFLLGTAVLQNQNSPLIAGIAIAVLIAAMFKLSGAHFNPAVTVALWATRKISTVKAVGYVVAQVLGAVLALSVVTQFTNTAPVNSLSLQGAPVVFSAQTRIVDTEQWRPILGEALGGLVLGLAVAGVVFNRKEGGEAGFVIGSGLLIAMLVASLGSVGIVNPALAATLSAYTSENWWANVAYALGPVAGVVVGVWLYKLFRWDIEGGKLVES